MGGARTGSRRGDAERFAVDLRGVLRLQNGVGQNVHLANLRSFSYNLVGMVTLQPVSATTLATPDSDPLRRSATRTAAPPTDSNASAQVEVNGLTDGTPKVLPGFAFIDAMDGGSNASQPQRTDRPGHPGWTCGRVARQIKQFTCWFLRCGRVADLLATRTVQPHAG